MSPFALNPKIPAAIAIAFAARFASAQNVVTATGTAPRPAVTVNVHAPAVKQPVVHNASLVAVHAPGVKQPVAHSASAVAVHTSPVKQPAARSANTVTVQTANVRQPAARTLTAVAVHHGAVKSPAHRAAFRPAMHHPAARLTPAIHSASNGSVQAAPFSQNPILSLRGNARALLVFAPDTQTPALKLQMQNLDEHTLELTQSDTIFVPIITQHHGADDVFPGENINSGTYRDQLSARKQFGLKYNDFAVIVLDKAGNEAFRSTKPVTVAELKTHLN